MTKIFMSTFIFVMANIDSYYICKLLDENNNPAAEQPVKIYPAFIDRKNPEPTLWVFGSYNIFISVFIF